MLCPDIWPKVIQGVPVRVFVNEIYISFGGLSKAGCLPQHGGTHPINEDMYRTKRSSERELFD